MYKSAFFRSIITPESYVEIKQAIRQGFSPEFMDILLEDAPPTFEELSALPIDTRPGAGVYLKEGVPRPKKGVRPVVYTGQTARRGTREGVWGFDCRFKEHRTSWDDHHLGM